MHSLFLPSAGWLLRLVLLKFTGAVMEVTAASSDLAVAA
jgi:hypothetical protein